MKPFTGSIDRDAIVRRIEANPIEGSPAAMREAFAHLVLGDDCEPYDEPGAAAVLGSPVIETREGVGSLTVLPRLATDEMGGVGGGERFAPDRMIVWFHGGGYVFGSPETHLRPAARLATLTQTPVLLPRYRLAPEHRWPAPLDDVLAIIRPLLDLDVRVVLAGDSAGGHLALVTALELAKAGTPVAGSLLCAPNTDRTGLSDTRAAMTRRDPMNADEDDRTLATEMFGDLPNDHPYVSPVLNDLSRLPPTHIEVGDPEVLLGDSIILHERGRRAGASVTLHVEPDFLHMGQLWTPWWSPANASLDRCASSAKQWLGVEARR